MWQKVALLILACAGGLYAQNPNPCRQVQNSATAGYVLSAVSSGNTPPCQWIAGGGGGGGGTVTNIATTLPITGGPITTTGTIGCRTATGSVSGCLSAADWTTFNGKGSGTVTSVGLAGTTNQITVTGSTPITGSGSWTLSLPATLVLPNGTTATTQSAADNSTKVATTAYVDTAGGSFVPTSRTISTTSPLGGGGALSSNLTLTCATCVLASSPGVGIAHFAGSTQTVTSSLIVAADITSATITGTQIASSIALAGSPTTTTQSPGDNSTKIATTAYVNAATGASGGFVLVEQHTASNSASLDFTTCVSATYDTYKITMTSIIPTTNDDRIGFRFNTGSGFDSGSNYSWEAFYLGNAASGGNGSTSDTTLNVVNDITNANSYQSLTGEYTLYAPQSATLDKSITGITNAPFASQGHNASGWFVSGYYKVASAVTQFQIVPNNGGGGHTIASGTVRCYGLAK